MWDTHFVETKGVNMNFENMDFAFDLDGVLFDWCKAFDGVYGVGASIQFDGLSKTEKDLVKTELSNGEFYTNLELMQKGAALVIHLVRAGRNVMILTSVGKQNPENVVRQKKEAIVRNFPTDVANVLIENFYFTTSSEDKAHFARPNLCLIDDRAKSREPFIRAGGVAVDIEVI